LTWLLHEDGIDLNGVVLQSPVLDYSQQNNSVGVLPTFAADAWKHKKVTVSPPPTDLASFMKQVEEFTRKKYADAIKDYPKVDKTTVRFLSEILGIPTEVLMYWKLDPTANFLTSLLQDKGLAVGSYDGRVKADDIGIAGSLDPSSGLNDPTITAIGGVYTVMWNVYLNEELNYTSTSPFMDLNDQAFLKWDFNHVDPTGAHKPSVNPSTPGPGLITLYTAGDLAASMEINPYLKVFCANGYYDAVTPFLQTKLDIEHMPLGSAENRHKILDNLEFHTYESGHMIYLDNESRRLMKKDLGEFYDKIHHHHIKDHVCRSKYRRRFTRTPY